MLALSWPKYIAGKAWGLDYAACAPLPLGISSIRIRSDRETHRTKEAIAGRLFLEFFESCQIGVILPRQGVCPDLRDSSIEFPANTVVNLLVETAMTFD